MGIGGHLLLLALAVLIAAQCLLLMEPRRPIDMRLRDLSTGGDAPLLLIAAALVSGATGALIGDLLGASGVGAAVGALAALATWLLAIAWANRKRSISRGTLE
jgi:hypothetical protein